MTVGDTEDNERIIDKTNMEATRDICIYIRREADDLQTYILRGYHKDCNRSFVMKSINRIKTLCEELEAHVQ